MNIKVLDNITINKIAAGEVVENAASVIKELVENSIDAKAKNIIVEVEGAGLKQIRVIDDGDGISKDNIKLAFQEHATSKIEKIDDLEIINSFGFRGEALPSIAAVSDVEIITKSKDDKSIYGYRYIVGRDDEIDEVAANVGTTIIVRNLFSRVPVRKKFLKEATKENAYIHDLMIKLALSHTNISFNLIIDGRHKLNTSGDGNIKTILYSIYGKYIYDNLLEVDDTYNGIGVKGVIAKPIIARNTRQDEIYFVNKRYIKNKTITNAVENAYEEYLMQHKYPLVVIEVSIDNKLVDVNVHPKKLEVRFSNETQVYFAIYEIISKALKNTNLIHEENLSKKDDAWRDSNFDIYNYYNTEVVDKKESDSDAKDINELQSLSSLFNKKIDSGLSIDNFNSNLMNDKALEVIPRNMKMVEKPFINRTLSEDHKYIGQIFDTYILVEFDNKLYIIDQHAAHEKINFEKIMKQYHEGKVDSQKIFPSIMLRLTPNEYEAVEKHIDDFAKVGFEIETFGDSDLKVDAVPYSIFDISSEKLLMDMIDSFADNKNKEEYDSIVEKIASISCKKAIKANHKLTEIEVKELLRELFLLENPYNCPHGRPTIISLSKAEFEKKFGRIV